MTKLNYRHGIATMNSQLEAHGELFTFAMQAGKPLYTLHKKIDSEDFKTRAIGYYSSASEAVEYINKRNGLV